jgi:hypothetical protein
MMIVTNPLTKEFEESPRLLPTSDSTSLFLRGIVKPPTRSLKGSLGS